MSGLIDQQRELSNVENQRVVDFQRTENLYLAQLAMEDRYKTMAENLTHGMKMLQEAVTIVEELRKNSEENLKAKLAVILSEHSRSQDQLEQENKEYVNDISNYCGFDKAWKSCVQENIKLSTDGDIIKCINQKIRQNNNIKVEMEVTQKTLSDHFTGQHGNFDRMMLHTKDKIRKVRNGLEQLQTGLQHYRQKNTLSEADEEMFQRTKAKRTQENSEYLKQMVLLADEM